MQLAKIKADITQEYGARVIVVYVCMCHSMMGTWYRVRCMDVASVVAWKWGWCPCQRGFQQQQLRCWRLQQQASDD